MNIVNKMKSNVDARSSAEKTMISNTKIKSTPNRNEVDGTDLNRTISWQAASSIILLLGITSLSYAIWFYNNQAHEPKLVQVAQFSKPIELKNEDNTATPGELATDKPTRSMLEDTNHSEMTSSIQTQLTDSEDKINVNNGLQELTSKKTIKPGSPVTPAALAKASTSAQPLAPIKQSIPTKKNTKINTSKDKPVEIAKTSKPTDKKLIHDKTGKSTKKEKQKSQLKPQNQIAKNSKKKTPVILPDTKLQDIKSGSKSITKSSSKPITSPVVQSSAKIAATSNTKSSIDKDKFNKQAIKFSSIQSAKKSYADALTKLNSGNTIEAKSLLQKTLTLKANHVPARKTLAGILINENNLEEAEKILREGIKKVPEASIFYHWLSRIYMENREYDEASILLLSGSKFAKDGEYFALMALAQQKTTGFLNAIASYRQALSYRPDESKWWLGLGIVLEKSDNWKEAEEAYHAALKSENLPFFLHNKTNERLSFVKNQIALAQKD